MNDDSGRMVAAMDAYIAELETQGAPDHEAFLARYPEIADRLRPCLNALGFMHGASDETTLVGRALGDYRIRREIGRGGMGIVYEAEQISLARRVALKVLPFAAVLDDRQLQRFRFEAQAASLLHHTNIVPVYAVGRERGVHYYSMQYIEGETLQAIISELRAGNARRSSSLDAITDERSSQSPAYCRAVARIGVQAACALDHAHQQGVIHRDVKPANMMVDAHGHLWITDFGLARSTTDTGLTLTGDLIGTARYMSPEQTLAKRVPVDHRTDVYSLGATLYETLTLTAAFPGDDPHRVMHDIAFREPVPPHRINPAVPAALEAIVLTALAKEPSERYATAADFAADLERFLVHLPIQARPPSLLDRAAKWSRRHRPVVAAAAAVVLIALVALIVTTVRIAGEQRRTQAALDDAELNFRRTLEAVDGLLFEVAVEDLQGAPAMTRTQDRLLRRALDFYERFLARGKDDKLERRAAQVHRRRAELLVLLGHGDEARESLELARAILTGLDGEDPDVMREWGLLLERESALAYEERDMQRALGLALESLGRRQAVAGMTGLAADSRQLARAQRAVGDRHSALGAKDEAKAALRDAVRIQESVVKNTDDPEHTTELADLIMELGKLHLDRHPPEEAERLFRRSLAVLESIPEHPNARKILAPAARNLAYCCAMTKRLDEAAALYERGAQALRSLVEDYPGVPSYGVRLARLEAAWGVSYYVNGQADEARPHARAAAESMGLLAARFPTPHWRYMHCVNLMNRAHMESYEVAIPLYTKCMGILDALATESDRTEESARGRAFVVTAKGPAHGFAQDHPNYRWHYWVMHTYRARRYFELNRDREALADFEARASALQDADGFEDVARVLVVSDPLRDLERAQQAARDGIDAKATDPECWTMLGLARYLAGDRAGAAEAATRALELGEEHHVHWLLAAAAGDEKERVASLAKARARFAEQARGPWPPGRFHRFLRDLAER